MSWISLGWLGIECGIAILAAVLAGSVAFLGFGIDTAIEALVSIIVVWRFSGERILSTTVEAKAQKAVAVSFSSSPLHRRGVGTHPGCRAPRRDHLASFHAVDAHLWAVYAKLGIRPRVRLAQLWEAWESHPRAS